jgi:hypothetical protein
MDQEQPPTATDVNVDLPPQSGSETETKDPASSKDQPVAAADQAGQGGSFPEQPKDNDDIIVEYHKKGKAVKPIAGKPPKH